MPDHIIVTLILFMLALVLGSNVVVFSLYLKVWSIVRHRGVGFTPLHVTLVSVSTLGLAAGWAWSLIDGVLATAETPTDIFVRFGLYVLCSAGVVAALVVMATGQYRRFELTPENVIVHRSS